MKFEKMIEKLKKCKKVRKVIWKEHEYIELKNNNLRDYDNCSYSFQGIDLFAEWELYQEPVKTFDFAQAKEALEKAGRVSRLAWLNDRNPKNTDYLFMGQYGIIYNRDSEGKNTSYSLDLSDLNATDWCLHNDLESRG